MGRKEDAEATGAVQADRSEVEALIQTALYNTDGEIVEGAFVDRWESYALNAVDALRETFARRGFDEADAALLRQAVSAPQAPLEAVLTLLSELGQWTIPLLESMLEDSSPRARLVAVSALGNTRTLWLANRPLDSAVFRRGLSDPDARVREATLQALAPLPVRKEVAEAENWFAHALDDEDPRVRTAAGSALQFLNRPEGAEVLARRLEHEPEEAVRKALLLAITQKIKTEGVHEGYGGRKPLREQVGERMMALLLRSLRHPDAPVRQEMASALILLRGDDVAAALLERLQQEQDPDARYDLLRYPDRQYCRIAGQALPVFSALLASDPSSAMRVQAVWVLASFGAAAIPLLTSALNDPFDGVRQAAARVLAMVDSSRSG